MPKGYDTAELHARAGEMFTMLGFDTLTGWAWVRNDDGEEGWLPGDILEATRPSS